MRHEWSSRATFVRAILHSANEWMTNALYNLQSEISCTNGSKGFHYADAYHELRMSQV
jgi:hypothetical protein